MKTNWKNSDLELISFFLLIKEYFRLVSIFIFISLVIAIFITSKVTPMWESTAIMQVGQLSLRDNKGSQNATSSPIETMATSAIRVKTSEFVTNVLKKLNLESVSVPYTSSLKATPMRNGDLIEIKFTYPDPETASTLMNATVNELIQIHNLSYEPFIKNLVHQQKTLDDEIKNKRIQISKFSSKISENNSIYLQFLLSETNYLEQRKLLVDQQLLPSLTFPTRLIGKIEVSRVPSASKKFSIIIFGLIIGLGLGGLVAYVHKNLK